MRANIVNLSIKNILFPSDFSPIADVGKQHALALAKHFGARLHLIHVVPISMVNPRSSSTWGTLENELNMQVELASQHLEKDASQASVESDRVTCTTVVGFEVEEILKYARENNIDLMVIGTHGRRGMSHFLLGSVAEKLVRMAECPVLTVHSEGRRILSGEPADAVSGHSPS